ncbi:MAG: SpaA isopeptide-forming pilin-related protein [Clostridium neonatale]
MGEKKMILRTKRLQLKDSIKKAYMKRMISICLIVSFIIGFSLDLNVFAEDKNDFSKYVTSMNFYDGDNNEISDGSTISTSDKIKAEYNFTISSSDISNGNLILELPEELEVEKSNIEVESDGYIGTASNEKNKTIISLMENSQYDTTADEVTTSDGVTVNEDKKIKGKLKLEMGFNAEKLEGLTSKIVRLTEDGLEFENSNLMKQQALLDATVNFPFITGVYLSDKDFKGDFDLSGTDFEANYNTYYNDTLKNKELEKSSQMYVGYKFKIPDGTNINNGDQFVMNIPNEFSKLLDEKTLSLKDNDGDTIANITYKNDNQIIITFTGASTGKSDVGGYFSFGRSFNKDNIGNENPVKITFDIPTFGKKDFNLDFKQPPFVEANPEITKDGSYSAQDQVINWKLTVKAGNLDKTDVLIKDVLDTTKHTFKSRSFKVDGNSVGDPTITEDVTANTSTLEYTLDNITAGNPSPERTIEFQTIPVQSILESQGKTTNISNEASLDFIKKDGTPETINSNNKTVGVINDFIKKSGTYRPETKDILWTVDINNSKVNFNNPIITDTLQEGLSLDTASVKLDNIINTGFTYDSSSGLFTFNNSPEDNSAHTLTFVTKIDESRLQDAYKGINSKVNNTIKLDVNGKQYSNIADEIGIGANSGGEAISKQAIGYYDKSSKEITWKITVNTIGLSIDDPIVTEIIGADQIYVDGSAEDESRNKLTAIQDSSNKNEYKISLGTNITGSKIITLKTKVTNEHIIYGNGNASVYNSCKLTGTNIATYTVNNVPQNVESTLIRKSGTYDYATRHLTWTIDVNASQTPIKGVKILDDILEGQEFLPGTFNVKHTAGTADNIADTIKDSKLTYTPKDSLEPGKGGNITYDFGDISDSYQITFDTKIAYDDEFSQKNEDIVAKNEAKLATSETGIDIRSSDSVTIKNYLIHKEAKYTSQTDFITWDVYINKNNIPLNGFTIVDNIKDGLQVDMDSIKLYTVDLDKNDLTGVTNQAEVSASNYTSNYSADTRKLEVNYSPSTTKSYLLEFDTIAKSSGSFSNSVSLDGNSTLYTSEKTGINVSFSDDIYGGGASGTSGSVIITKVDKDDNNKKLDGAVFELIKDEKVVQTSEPTVNGVTKFTRLKFGVDYHIKEIKAPKGYVLDGTKDTLVNIKKDTTIPANNVKKINIINEKIKKDIKFKKEDSDGQPIKGTEFKLYLASDTFFSDPKGTAVSDENGFVLFKDIAVDPSKSVEYEIKETKTPTGYVTYADKITATIAPDGNNDYVVNVTPSEVVNKFIQKNIKLLKTSADGAKLKGATFMLYKNGDETIPVGDPAYSDENGIVEFKDVDYGDYVIKETQAPNGFDPSADSIVVNKSDFETADAFFDKGTVVNTKTKPQKIIEFYKESDGGTTLKDAIFSIYKETDTDFKSPVSITGSDSTGLVRFTNIKAGDYKIKETKAPKGYELSDTVISIKESDFEVAGEVIKTNPYKIVNKEIIKTIELYKQDINGNPLKDAIFSLYKLEDVNFENPISSAVSDDNGIVKFINVKAGNYKIKETKAPEGYKLSEEVINITIDEFNGTDDVIRTSPYEFINKLIPTNGGGSGGGGGSSSSSKKHKDDKDEEEIITTDPEEKTEIDNNTKVEQENNQNTGNNFLNATEGSPSGSQYTLYDKNGNEISAGVDTNGTNGTNYTSGEEKIKAKSKKEKLPQAGRFIDSTVLIISGLILIILGFAYNLKRKKSVKF